MSTSIHNLLRIVTEADEVLNGEETPDVMDVVDWIECAKELALELLERHKGKINTKELENGLWVAYNKEKGLSAIGTTEAEAENAILFMLQAHEPLPTPKPVTPNTTTMPCITGSYDGPFKPYGWGDSSPYDWSAPSVSTRSGGLSG